MHKNQTIIAFLRGIGPGNPNMRNDKLREAFEKLGLQNVRSVISSGNIIFETKTSNLPKLENEIERHLKTYLGITSSTILRTKPEIENFIDRRPFGNMQHSRTKYLMVTFIKNRLADLKALDPADYTSDNFEIKSFDIKIQAVCSVTDPTKDKIPNFMIWLEKQFGKGITTRTWKTIERISAKL